MKKAILIFGLGLSFTSIGLVGCGGSKSTETQSSEVTKTQYYCPMKCEEDKTYTEKGECPVCKMDLKGVK